MPEPVTKTCKNDWCEKPADPTYGDNTLAGFCESCQIIIRHERRIISLVSRLNLQVQCIEAAVRAATGTLDELTSCQVYDVEFAEGAIGADARAELDEMMRKIRNVQRCVAERQRIITDGSGS